MGFVFFNLLIKHCRSSPELVPSNLVSKVQNHSQFLCTVIVATSFQVLVHRPTAAGPPGTHLLLGPRLDGLFNLLITQDIPSDQRVRGTRLDGWRSPRAGSFLMLSTPSS